MKKYLMAALAVILIIPIEGAGPRHMHWRFDPSTNTAKILFRQGGGSLNVVCEAHLPQVVVKRTDRLGVGERSGRAVFFTVDNVAQETWLWHYDGSTATLSSPEQTKALLDALQAGKSVWLSVRDAKGEVSHHEALLDGADAAIGKVRAACAAS